MFNSLFKKTIAILFTVAWLLGYCVSSFANDVSFIVSVDRTEVTLGTTAQLTLTINGAKQLSELNLPDFEGFQVRYRGPTSRFTIVNGKSSRSTSYNYTLFPLRVGEFTIPSFTIEVGGQPYKSESIKMKIVDESTQTASTKSGSGSVSLEDKIFARLEINKQKYYIHEKIQATIRLFVQNVQMDGIDLTSIQSAGFTIGKVTDLEPYQRVINGLRYAVKEFRVELYPTRTGKLVLGPAKIDGNIVYQNSSRSRSAFDFFFDINERQPVVVKAKEVDLEVFPFPDKGKPEGFSEGVGEFGFNVTATPKEINEGDPITIRMIVEGTGDLNLVQMPELKESEFFKVYEPQIKIENQQKVLEQVIIPKNVDIKEIAKINFSYFDTKKEDYVTLSKGPFPVTINKSSTSTAVPVTSSALVPTEVTPQKETLGEDIVFIKEYPGKFLKPGAFFYNGNLFKALILILCSVFAILYVLYFQNRRMKSDHAYARRLKAPKRAKVGLTKAKQLMSSDKYEDFFNVIFKTFQDYIGNKFHLSSQGLTKAELNAVLTKNKVDSDIIEKAKEILDCCEEARFASVSTSQHKAKEIHQSCESIIDYFERKY